MSKDTKGMLDHIMSGEDKLVLKYDTKLKGEIQSDLLPPIGSDTLGNVTAGSYDDSGIITSAMINDPINPNHYKFGDMESKPFINNVCKYGGFLPEETPNIKDIIKYLIRYPRKNGIEDLKKCKWYLDELIEIREEIENNKTSDDNVPDNGGTISISNIISDKMVNSDVKPPMYTTTTSLYIGQLLKKIEDKRVLISDDYKRSANDIEVLKEIANVKSGVSSNVLKMIDEQIQNYVLHTSQIKTNIIQHNISNSLSSIIDPSVTDNTIATSESFRGIGKDIGSINGKIN